MVAGDFVADVSNYGVTAGFPAVHRGRLSLTCPGATRIEAWGDGGSLLTSVAGDAHVVVMDGRGPYARLVAVGDYTEAFGSALSDRWKAVDGTWSAAAGGVLGRHER